MARDIQSHSTRNPLIKPIQLENNKKQRKKEQLEAAMAIGGGNGDRQKLAEERLRRERKIDQMRGRKKELCAKREREREREREGAES